jgi:hypothetical protein
VRALLRPEAADSARRREVRLLKPLVNWRHVLATISRMREYATELGFAIPEEQEAFAWSVFTEQDQEMQAGMLDRYRQSSHHNPRIEEEARCKLRR